MRRGKGLSLRQQRIIDFIRDFRRDNGMPPTVRDIQNGCEISSTSVVDYNLRLLQRDEYVIRKPDVARGIELVGEVLPEQERGDPPRRAAVLGYIAAGEPLPVAGGEGWAPDQGLDVVDVPSHIGRPDGPLYALRVKGQSMIDALVDDGDIVLVEPTHEVPNGTMVVARLKLENETTLKRLYQEGDRIRLQPANSQMEPIYSPAGNIEVQGRVVGVIRAL